MTITVIPITIIIVSYLFDHHHDHHDHNQVWFLTRALDGLLLYNGGKPSGGGDFISLNLVIVIIIIVIINFIIAIIIIFVIIAIIMIAIAVFNSFVSLLYHIL